MAGGIDWFRWYHGTVNDQKFSLVARKSGATVAEVIAVWACLLERSSQADDRGTLGEPDFEAMDCALGMADGKAAAIFAALQSRALIDADARLTAWSSRQPKKEDDTAAERKRAQREREATAKAEAERDKQDCHNESRDVTLEERRGEERREDSHSVEREEDTPPPTPAGAVCLALKAEGIWPLNPSHPTLLVLLAAGASTAEFVDAAHKAKGKRDSFEYLLGVVKGRREDAAKAAQGLHVGPMPARAPPSETIRERSARQRMNELAPGVAAKAPGSKQTEVIDGNAKLIAGTMG